MNAIEEKVIMEGLCNRIKNKFFVENGYGILTNKRFIYSKHKLKNIAVMGLLVNLTKGDFEFEIPVSEIIEIRQGRQGFSKTIILVTKNNEYNFYVKDRTDWLISLNNATNLNIKLF